MYSGIVLGFSQLFKVNIIISIFHMGKLGLINS